MHGEVTDSQSVVLAAADYKALKKDKAFARYVHSLSTTHTLLFVGYSLQDEDLLLFLNHVFVAAGGHTVLTMRLLTRRRPRQRGGRSSTPSTASGSSRIVPAGIRISSVSCWNWRRLCGSGDRDGGC